jgi:hypothetical protein
MAIIIKSIMTPITKNILLFIFARSCVGVAKLL